ncbi:MAG: glycosyltransferase [Bacteroides sp.]|nr:glycosyltransferase [Bacteroides sp.]
MNQRVLLVIDQIASGGAEKILQEFNEYLKCCGYETKIFALYGCSGESVDFGLKRNSTNLIKKWIQQKFLLRKLQKVENEFSPDIIFSFLERSNILVSKLDTNAKKIATVHNILSIQYKKLGRLMQRLVQSIIRRAYSNLDEIVVVSDNVRQDLILKYRIDARSISIINNRVDRMEIISKSMEPIVEFDYDADTSYVISIGRFCHQKAQWKFIKAIKGLKTRYPQLKIKGVIIGEGEYKDRLCDYARSIDVQEDIIILPYQSNPYKFIAKSSLFLLPSFFEGCPIVLSEVIALGIPFVGSEPAIPKEYFGSEQRVWSDATFEVMDFEEFNTAITEESEIIVDKICNQLERKTSVSATRDWNRSNDKKNQFDEYIKIFHS